MARQAAIKAKRIDLFGISDEEKALPTLTTFNTGTMFDLLVGDVTRGYDNKWYVNGGLGHNITGIYGKPNSFKSTIMMSFIARVLAIYQAQGLTIDTEAALTSNRFITCAGTFSTMIAPDQIHIRSGAVTSLEDVVKILKQAIAMKLENRKDFLIETPFVNPYTGKRCMAWAPTICGIDTFSELRSGAEDDLIDTEGIEGKKSKTWAMVDGSQKTMFVRLIRPMCERYGIVLVCTSHAGANINMDSYFPPEKKLQHMKQDEALKNVGSKFYTLTKNLIATVRPKTLNDNPKKECDYGFGPTPNDDLNEVTLGVIRCKTNNSGAQLPMVVSQKLGLLDDVTHYHYLRKIKGYAGLPGSDKRHSCSFLPDISLTRNSMREEASKSYELRRALEICAQLLFIQERWIPIPELAHGWAITPDQMYEKLQAVGSPKISDILNSRGYWTIDGTCDRPYMSIFDIIELLPK